MDLEWTGRVHHALKVTSDSETLYWNVIPRTMLRTTMITAEGGATLCALVWLRTSKIIVFLLTCQKLLGRTCYFQSRRTQKQDSLVLAPHLFADLSGAWASFILRFTVRERFQNPAHLHWVFVIILDHISAFASSSIIWLSRTSSFEDLSSGVVQDSLHGQATWNLSATTREIWSVRPNW